MKKVKVTTELITNILQWAVVVVLFVTALLLVFANLDNPLNLRVYSVTSGSMEPSISTGSLVFVRPQEQYNEQDIITYFRFTNPENTTTHRIISVSEDVDLGSRSFITKGDANEEVDAGFIRPAQVIGKVLFSVPLLGYLVAFAKTQMGFMFLVVIPATILIYSELVNIKNELSGVNFSFKKKNNSTNKEKTSSIGQVSLSDVKKGNDSKKKVIYKKKKKDGEK